MKYSFLQKYKIYWIIAALIITGSLLIIFISHNQEPTNQKGLVSSPQGVDISVLVADTDKTRAQGLSGRESLASREGMWFMFPQSGYYSFWMKDMNFPIDIIWIDENFRIIDRTLRVDPATYPKTFTSSGPSKYVLEIPAGTADEYGLFIRSTVMFTEQ